jgi:VanZ family protein
MKWRGWLIFWILAIVFPTAALGRYSPTFRQAFDTIFAPNWMHVLMHAVLYAGLCALLILPFRLPFSARSMAVILGVVFGVGMLQEGFQAFNQGTFSLEASLTDLMVDLTGGLLALLFYGLVAMKSRAY